MGMQSGSGLGKLRGMFGAKPDNAPRTPDPTGTASDMRQAFLLLRDYENSGLGWFWSTDAEGRIAYISECIAEKFGKTGADLAGQPFHSLFVLERDENDTRERTLPLVLSGHKTFAELSVRAATQGTEIWLAISGRPQFTTSGDFTGYRGNGADVTSSRQSQIDASRMAQFDSLTGLANRHRMSKRLIATLTAYKSAKRSCAVMMIDLDRFKQVNDTLGHPAGDELLKQVAQRLGNVIEKSCEIGRLGGDEFQVILPDMDDRGKLGDLAKRIISIVSQPYSIEGSRCIIGASVGIAIAPYDGIDADELIRSADLALYAAKGGGRGQFRFYSSELHEVAEHRRRIEEDLRDALAKDEIHLAYQPVIDVNDNRVVALEAVMRWRHPELGDVSPGVFIPIAEETNLIAGLGEWALMQACRDAAGWPGDVRVAVNVSPVQFGNPALTSVVTQALASSGLQPQRLELELTESVFLSDSNSTDQMLAALNNLDVRLVLDDFGTGYSSLAYLRRAPFDKIKIDKAFIEGVTEEGSRNVAIIQSIVSLAEGLGMEVVAEGIEALDELAKIRSLGVGKVQGFIYARPMAKEHADEAMANGAWKITPVGPTKYRPDRTTVFRKTGLIHEDHRYDVTMRNISRTGCLVEGMAGVPVGTKFVVDFGEGQLAVATVRRTKDTSLGLEFEQSLVDDGAGGLCTRHRVSPYVLASAGMPLAALPPGQYPLGPGGAGGSAPRSTPRFIQASETVRASKSAL